jgi:hypothetical protein
MSKPEPSETEIKEDFQISRFVLGNGHTESDIQEYAFCGSNKKKMVKTFKRTFSEFLIQSVSCDIYIALARDPVFHITNLPLFIVCMAYL